MDRVFALSKEQDPVVQLNIKANPAQLQARNWKMFSLSILAATGLISSLWLGRNLNVSSMQLNRERNLLLLERLRHLPATAQSSQSSKTDHNGDATKHNSTEVGNHHRDSVETGQQLQANEAEPSELPPPPEPAWLQALEPITVPFPSDSPGAPQATTPVAPTHGARAETLPALVGVVHAPSSTSSAIFQLDNASTSITPGETIGNSGWRLATISAEGAVIEREGERRQLSVGGAF